MPFKTPFKIKCMLSMGIWYRPTYFEENIFRERPQTDKCLKAFQTLRKRFKRFDTLKKLFEVLVETIKAFV